MLALLLYGDIPLFPRLPRLFTQETGISLTRASCLPTVWDLHAILSRN